MPRPLPLLAALASFWLAAPAAKPAELIMFEQPGCEWCARWNAEVGEAYPVSEEGRRAPLRREDISSQPLQDVSLVSRAAFTPTFVLVDEGREVGRIEGYPGPDFFWPMLERLMDRLPERDGEAAGG